MAAATTARAEQPSADERGAAGKRARKEVPRGSHAAWDPPSDRRDPVEILDAQSVSRVPELVPIRYGRMLVSPFTFYRGAAAIMAADLAGTPDSGLKVQACGDAHLSNFGAFAAPDRRMVFDLNDFDETLPAPWEWDVKRLAASLEIAGRDRALARALRREIVAGAVREYREAMRGFASASNLDVWYARVDIEDALETLSGSVSAKQRKRAERNVEKARLKDSRRAIAKLTTTVDGRLRFVSDPPLLVPVEEVVDLDAVDDVERELRELLRGYRRTLPDDRRHLLDGYRYVHMARKVVGVGSVGTRAWVILMEGLDGDDPLVLQAKEAQASVLEPYAGASRYRNHGERVVAGQKLMQAASDIFMGWQRVTGMDDQRRDFYVRQLWDGKGSVDLDTIDGARLGLYSRLCGWTLARAHARSGDRVAIAAYLGGGESFDRAIAEFSAAYADQNERDYAAMLAAVKDGRIEAAPVV